MDSTKFSYQRLKKLPSISTIDKVHEADAEQVVNYVRRTTKKRWAVRVGRRRWIRKPRIRILRLTTSVRRVVRKVVKRIKEGKPYIGDLFAGNYLMFMQVSPSSLKLPSYTSSLDYFNKPYLGGAGSHCHYPAVRSLQFQT